jgi:TetR/AcrR family transcriptional regulator, transcriptional repressor for nem operon
MPTADLILDSAERLVRVRGYNAFSYADVAGELGITKASLHYHFAGKAELGLALITRYSNRFAAALEEIDRDLNRPPEKLAAYAELYADALRGRRMCLCGMLAADYETLAEPLRAAVVSFFDENERWLARVLGAGRDEGLLGFEGPPNETARMIISGLEGAMLLARPYGDVRRFQSAARALLASLSR